jgi:CheY-like chemotaxis protein
MLIMMVDDDPEDRDFFTEVISDIDSKITYITTGSGMTALKILEEIEKLPDYIFLDLNMPCMNGKQCLEKIKQNNRLKHIPVIIYSTSKLTSDIDETRILGASFFLTKPTSLEEMKTSILSIIASDEMANNEKSLIIL